MCGRTAAQAILTALGFTMATLGAGGALPLEPVYSVKADRDAQRLYTRSQLTSVAAPRGASEAAFHAIVTNAWLRGLVPVFVIEGEHRWQLRRFPLRGQENAAEPLFFALPPEDEPQAEKLAGRWDVIATRADGSKQYFAWELTVDRERVAGRFEQSTEFRFAYVTGGTFRSNLLELRIEYIMDAYVATGTWQNNKLEGTWQHTNDADGESGSWEASRAPAAAFNTNHTVALYEWRRASDDERRYAVEGTKLSGEWQRSARPLCRVWQEQR